MFLDSAAVTVFVLLECVRYIQYCHYYTEPTVKDYVLDFTPKIGTTRAELSIFTLRISSFSRMVSGSGSGLSLVHSPHVCMYSVRLSVIPPKRKKETHFIS